MKQKLRNTILAMAFTGLLLALIPEQGTVPPTPDNVQAPATTEAPDGENGIAPMSDNEEINTL